MPRERVVRPQNGIVSPCAFGGLNQNQAQMFFLFPEGRSEYNALQMTLKQNVNNPVRGVKAANFQASYSLSRFSNSGGIQLSGTPADNDQDFVLQSADNNNPSRYFGPSLLDRTHQISFGGLRGCSVRISHWAYFSLLQPISEFDRRS